MKCVLNIHYIQIYETCLSFNFIFEQRVTPIFLDALFFLRGFYFTYFPCGTSILSLFVKKNKTSLVFYKGKSSPIENCLIDIYVLHVSSISFMLITFGYLI